MRLSTNFKLAFIFLLSSFVFSSCKKNSTTIETPAYIHIDSIRLDVLFAYQGSSSNKITDAWVYIDDQLIGAFELPVTFPVLMAGEHKIKIKAGIKINGIAATRTFYPFYTAYEQTINLSPEKIITLSPLVHYSSQTKFAWLEDFEKQSISLTINNSDTILQKTKIATDVFEGKVSGIVFLDATHTFFECISDTNYVLPKNGDPVFLELNYKTNNQFRVGIYAHKPSGNTQVEALIINPSINWNKIYISLSSVLNGEQDATRFGIYIGMLKDQNVINSNLVIDNIKLVN